MPIAENPLRPNAAILNSLPVSWQVLVMVKHAATSEQFAIWDRRLENWMVTCAVFVEITCSLSNMNVRHQVTSGRCLNGIWRHLGITQSRPNLITTNV